MSSMLRLVLVAALSSASAWAAGTAPAAPVPFEDDGQWGYRDPSGTVVIAPRFLMAEPFSPQGIAAVADAVGWAYIGRDGAVLLRPLVVDNGPDAFVEGLARFKEKGKVGFFGEDGAVRIEASLDYAAPFGEGRAAFCVGCREEPVGEHVRVVDGKWGYIDATGAVVIPPAFEEAGEFEGGCARVLQQGRRFAIDKRGQEVADPAGCKDSE